MSWITLTPVDGPKAIFNTDNIAYVAAPPENKAERGVGAGIALIDNTDNVIPVSESPEDIMEMIWQEEKRK